LVVLAVGAYADGATSFGLFYSSVFLMGMSAAVGIPTSFVLWRQHLAERDRSFFGKR
jgi:hypothetical protein